MILVPRSTFMIGFFPLLSLNNYPRLICRKRKSKILKSGRGRAKRLFYDACTRINGLLLVPNNKGVMIRGCLGRQSFDLLLGLSLRISICIFRLHRVLHCPKEVNLSHFPKLWRGSLGKRNGREKSLLRRKSVILLFAFPDKIFGPR